MTSFARVEVCRALLSVLSGVVSLYAARQLSSAKLTPYITLSYNSSDTMSNRQWVYTERGRLSTTIKQTTGPIPDAKEGEVVIKVKAAALNPVENQMYGFEATCTLSSQLIHSAQSSDALLRFIGAPPHGTPFVPCWDFSGTIHRLGAGVTDFVLGDEVFGVLLNMTGMTRYAIPVRARSKVDNQAMAPCRTTSLYPPLIPSSARPRHSHGQMPLLCLSSTALSIQR